MRGARSVPFIPRSLSITHFQSSPVTSQASVRVIVALCHRNLRALYHRNLRALCHRNLRAACFVCRFCPHVSTHLPPALLLSTFPFSRYSCRVCTLVVPIALPIPLSPSAPSPFLLRSPPTTYSLSTRVSGLLLSLSLYLFRTRLTPRHFFLLHHSPTPCWYRL